MIKNIILSTILFIMILSGPVYAVTDISISDIDISPKKIFSIY